MPRPPRKILRAAIACASMRALAPAVARGGQRDDVRRRLEALEAGQKEILRQLHELRTATEQNRPPALPLAPIAVEGSATRGSSSAKLTIVELSDCQCPYCGRFSRDTFDQLDGDYISTGKVRYVFRNFPIEKIHPRAFKAAVAGECARQTGKFWELHHRLFASQQLLGDVDLLNHAKAVGVDGAAFQRCVVAPAATAKVRQDVDEGVRSGITGTPTCFLGVVQSDGRLEALHKIPGAVRYATFKATIDSLLASPELQE